jgi:hypothetical protein
VDKQTIDKMAVIWQITDEALQEGFLKVLAKYHLRANLKFDCVIDRRAQFQIALRRSPDTPLQFTEAMREFKNHPTLRGAYIEALQWLAYAFADDAELEGFRGLNLNPPT